MKVLCIDGERYLFPNSKNQSLDSFMNTVELTEYVKLTRLVDENCVHPYYIDEDVRPVYVNLAVCSVIEEDEVVLMPRKEYEKRVLELSKKICVGCSEYAEDFLNEKSAETYKNKICLNGTCDFFCEE